MSSIENAHQFVIRESRTIASDRIYRVVLWNGSLYFLRIGGQFNVDRAASAVPVIRKTPLGVQELGEVRVIQPPHLFILPFIWLCERLFRKHKVQELAARDVNAAPNKLLSTHPHNFKLCSADLTHVTLLKPHAFVSHFRPHNGRLKLELRDGTSRSFVFESVEELAAACEAFKALGIPLKHA